MIPSWSYPIHIPSCNSPPLCFTMRSFRKIVLELCKYKAGEPTADGGRNKPKDKPIVCHASCRNKRNINAMKPGFAYCQRKLRCQKKCQSAHDKDHSDSCRSCIGDNDRIVGQIIFCHDVYHLPPSGTKPTVSSQRFSLYGVASYSHSLCTLATVL